MESDEYDTAEPAIVDDDVCPPEPVDQEAFRRMDEYILQQPSRPQKIGQNVMRRSDILNENFDIVDNALPVHVDAYNADFLESGLIRQAETALDSAQGANNTNSNAEDAVQHMLKSSDAIKFGTKTPFELMHEKQLNDVRAQNSRRQQRYENIAKEKPSTSKATSDSDYSGSESEEWITDEAESDVDVPSTSKRTRRTSKKHQKIRDDGNEDEFKDRLRDYYNEQQDLQSKGQPNDLEQKYTRIVEEIKVTSHIWDRLYQKTGVRWLLQLHEQFVGGILADEMGLGKTIQVSLLLRAIAESRLTSRIFDYTGLGPTLIITPATLMMQWVRELHSWFPRCRVAVYHSSGSFNGSKKRLLNIISTPRPNGSILITSYSTYTKIYKEFLKVNWHYVILDEGHKIRNPETKVTLSLKELRTPHRLILSGSPMQNNLKELWSLIDFIYPGRLGSLKEFSERFALPITQGGYVNATKMQVRAAYKCACLLRDAINPYMLRRMKKDVELVLKLPEKSEQVLFCDITDFQRRLYQDYISSKEIRSILDGKADAFVGLITLRKLCNHPDLITGGPNRDDSAGKRGTMDDEFGASCRSGKMMVVESLLMLWHKQKQKVLLFSQSKQMLTILEKLVVIQGYKYLRMDGGTPIGSRQALVQKFNSEPDIFVFLLTTRVGGLGLNLTSANRIVIFDPDWNPSTDAQARERAWRIGQNRAVTIYRLMTSGTIEEKIYQRQIFKQFLTNRILVDPKQRRFFKSNDLQELFSLGDNRNDEEHGTETAAVFCGESKEINKKNFFDARAKQKKKAEKERKKREADEEDEEISDVDNVEITLTEEFKQQLRDKARRLAMMHSKEPRATTVQPVAVVNEDVGTPENHAPEAESENKHDKKKKDKKKYKTKLLDGKFKIKYLRKQRTHREKDGEENTKKTEDDYVLAHLLKSTNVHSALHHDQIVGEAVDKADLQLVEDEANSVANRAAEVLKRSRRQHSQFVQFSCATKPKLFGRRKAIVFGNDDNGTEKLDVESEKMLPEVFNGEMKSDIAGPSKTLSSSELSSLIQKRRVQQLESAVAYNEATDEDPEVQHLFSSTMPISAMEEDRVGDAGDTAMETDEDESIQWRFFQVKASLDAMADETPTEADMITAVQFSDEGDLLATGDRGGRIVIFKRESVPKNDEGICEYNVYSTFQSHEAEFDYLKSLEIEEKINQIKWMKKKSNSDFVLSTNDKTIKLWKISERRKKLSDKTLNLKDCEGRMKRATDELMLPELEDMPIVTEATPRRVYSNAHTYHINSISLNADQDTFISADDLRINLWHHEITNQTFTIVDIKPTNMEELTEVITSAEYHPSSGHLFAYGSSKGLAKLCDTRQNALCDDAVRTFDARDESRGFFSEIVSSVSDVKFAHNGKYLMTRDYLSVYIWDLTMESEPVTVFNVHDYLRNRFCNLYESDSIFDKFECAWSGDDKKILTGSYNNHFRTYNCETRADSTYEASSLLNRRDGSTGRRTGINAETPLDFNKKILHCAYHPLEDIAALGVANKVYLFRGGN